MNGTRAAIAAGILTALLAAASAAPAADREGEPGADRPERFDTVVIDPGHGGEDTGARGAAGALEKDVVLAVARDLASRLRARDLRVVLTRESDRTVSLERRTAIANDARGDLFLSIHANAASDQGARGTETYFLALEASDAEAAGVAARENRAFAGGDAPEIEALGDPFIALLSDMIATEHLAESSALARRVQHALEAAPLSGRGVKQALFVVLNGVQMPAALVEIGFITNAEDERLLTSASGRESIAVALERAVVAFGQRFDARRGAIAAGTAAAEGE